MLNKHSHIFIFLIILGISLASCSPSGESGIEVPIVVNRVDMLVSKVKMMDTLVGGLEVLPGGEIKATTITPVNPYDTFLFIEATTKHNGNQDPCSWSGKDAVGVSFEKDGITQKTGLFDCYIDYDEDFIRFYFPVFKNGGSNYHLMLPNNKSIALDGLLP